MKITLSILLMFLSLSYLTCKGKEEKKDIQQVSISHAPLEEGKRLFKDKTCSTCHLLDKTLIGPSIATIKERYTEENQSIFDYLKGNSPAIVDTTPAQVALMKANLDGFVKDLTDQEIKALAHYILNAN